MTDKNHNFLLKQKIRKHARLQRLSLTMTQQDEAAKRVANIIGQDKRIKEANNFAIFISFDGEINTNYLINMLWNKNKKVYLPALHPLKNRPLLFINYTPTTSLVVNRLNLYEPPLDFKKVLSLEQIDILFIPLVAFDYYGNRLGMGGGFYDRTLQQYNNKLSCFIIGLAHDCQYYTTISLPIDRWDVPLPEIITPSFHFNWNQSFYNKKQN
ncbi:5-formyltetrahydrofolate cyclo-ligase [Candidatus Palibaumannia cicadellinicola]|uniref:5-formyltetrahydrofolate cyclo-ligase n=1 Tax=Candidatus Palibaumannia cicadellinicola TaxID=186490 RepID=A0A0K2BLU8_9GAMM|nr:5-formyltetrahydrofolate cyclo-ligase [Candidatus Baumannia cicadellinicola]AKZ66169.1 5-formyltetrahydrofolate cyclo-ligase [Candidatus Baumannia cicadellinicola]